MLKKLGLLSLATASLMAMHEAEININNVDIEAGLKLDMGQFNDAVEPDTMFVGVKYLNPDRDHSDFGNPKSYFEASFFMQRDIGSSGFFAGLGVKLNYIDNDITLDYISIPLSLKAGYNIPTTIPMRLALEAHYAPQVLSLQDAEGYKEYRLNYDIEIIKNASINLGYRNIQTKYENGSYEKYNSSGYIGFKFHF